MKKKEYLQLFYALEKDIWGDKMNTNPYFASVSILFVSLLVAIFCGGRFLEVGEMSLVPIFCVTALLLCANIYESIIATSSLAVAAGRSALWLGFLILMVGLSIVLSVVLIIGVIFAIGMMFLGGMLRSGGSSSSSSSSGSSSEPELWGYDENGSGHKLQNTGGGYARDESGRRWKNDGGTKYHLDE